jgi:hypothetical protein
VAEERESGEDLGRNLGRTRQDEQVGHDHLRIRPLYRC